MTVRVWVRVSACEWLALAEAASNWNFGGTWITVLLTDQETRVLNLPLFLRFFPSLSFFVKQRYLQVRRRQHRLVFFLSFAWKRMFLFKSVFAEFKILFRRRTQKRLVSFFDLVLRRRRRRRRRRRCRHPQFFFRIDTKMPRTVRGSHKDWCWWTRNKAEIATSQVTWPPADQSERRAIQTEGISGARLAVQLLPYCCVHGIIKNCARFTFKKACAYTHHRQRRVLSLSLSLLLSHARTHVRTHTFLSQTHILLPLCSIVLRIPLVLSLPPFVSLSHSVWHPPSSHPLPLSLLSLLCLI